MKHPRHFTALFAFFAIFASALFAHVEIQDTVAGYMLGKKASDKIAFHGATPVIQRSGSAQAVVTDTAANLTGTLTGTANGSLVDIAATAAATAGSAEPSAAQVDEGIATAVASIVTGVNEQNKEMQAQINKLITDNAAKTVLINELRAALVAKGLITGS